jgi:hypothetical protein
MSDPVCFIKHQKVLVPADDAALELFASWKQGAVINGKFTQMRNGAFFRKWWSMVKFAFDYWEDGCERMEYKGRPVMPEFDRFRKDLIILAGYYAPVWNIRGEMRIEHESLRWGSMTEQRFTKLYDDTFTYLINEVFNGKRAIKMSAEQLAHALETLDSFA